MILETILLLFQIWFSPWSTIMGQLRLVKDEFDCPTKCVDYNWCDNLTQTCFVAAREIVPGSTVLVFKDGILLQKNINYINDSRYVRILTKNIKWVALIYLSINPDPTTPQMMIR